MGIMQQYECPKCGYKPPILHFGCGFHLSYKVYVCRICKVVQSSVYHIHCSYRKDEEKEYREKQVLIPSTFNTIEIETGFCSHNSFQELYSIPYNKKTDLSLFDDSIPHFKFYYPAKDIAEVSSIGRRHFVRCNDCNREIEFDVFEDSLKNKCALCGNKDLEEWNEPYCPKCGKEMVLGVSDEGSFWGEWD